MKENYIESKPKTVPLELGDINKGDRFAILDDSGNPIEVVVDKDIIGGVIKLRQVGGVLNGRTYEVSLNDLHWKIDAASK